MNVTTGAVAVFETDEDAKKAGYDVKLSKEIAEKLQTMPREERLRVISDDIKTATAAHPLAKLAGMTDDDIRALRNAAKRARRARRK